MIYHHIIWGLTEEVKSTLALVVVVVVVEEPAAVDVLIVALERHLPRKTGGPDDDGHDCDERECNVSTSFTLAVLSIENEETDQERASDGADCREGAVKSTSGTVEQTSVDSVLVRVEVVRREEHGEQGCKFETDETRHGLLVV